MYFVDYHSHTRCSPDSTARLEDMAAAARQAGLAELCTTDHCDLQLEDGSPLKSWDWTAVRQQFDRAASRFCRSDFRLLLGVELGGAQTNPRQAGEILSGAPLDFVIGSVHNMSPAAGGLDLSTLDYSTEEVCRRVLEDYMSCLLDLAPLPCYDSLGHIIYPLRYINGRAGFSFTLEPWADQMDQVLRTVIETGRSMEVNTHGGKEIQEWRPVLERYRALGGEYITVGADAHSPLRVGRGIQQAMELLRDTGFRWLTVYRQRIPERIKL